MRRRPTRGGTWRLLTGLVAVSFSFAAVAAEPPPREGRLRVDSSSIAAIGYDRQARLLHVEFRSGARYRYREVPEAVFAAFLNAESKGRYFAQYVRGKFAYERIEGREP